MGRTVACRLGGQIDQQKIRETGRSLALDGRVDGRGTTTNQKLALLVIRVLERRGNWGGACGADAVPSFDHRNDLQKLIIFKLKY